MLPVLVLIVVPILIVVLTNSLNPGWSLDGSLVVIPILLGMLFIAIGLRLLIATISLFIKHGEGTLAPWDPTQQLVIKGIYRYVRNPMHLGVFLVLYGEGLALGSAPILIFVSVVFVLHLFYIPFSEERGLERRFEEDFLTYKNNVPRWIPRLRPWDQKG